jgi:hypothetical protein
LPYNSSQLNKIFANVYGILVYCVRRFLPNGKISSSLWYLPLSLNC